MINSPLFSVFLNSLAFLQFKPNFMGIVLECMTIQNKFLKKGKTYRRCYILGPMALNYWVIELFRLCETPNGQSKTLNPTPHRPLSGALSGPDSAALRTIAWFCRRVWLFDYGSYSNRKERSVFSVPESMPVGCTMFYISWEFQNGSYIA
jgi:hypothetical protein